jgi:hypothetical protein
MFGTLLFREIRYTIIPLLTFKQLRQWLRVASPKLISKVDGVTQFCLDIILIPNVQKWQFLAVFMHGQDGLLIMMQK